MGNSKIIKTMLTIFLSVTILIMSISYFTGFRTPWTTRQLRVVRSESKAIRHSVTMGEVVDTFKLNGGRTLGKSSSAKFKISYSSIANKSTEDLFDELETILLNNDWILSKQLKEDGTNLHFTKSIDDEVFKAVLAIWTDDSQNTIAYVRIQSRSFY